MPTHNYLDKQGTQYNITAAKQRLAALTQSISDLADVASGLATELDGLEDDLKTVAFSGSYNDLSNKPTIPDISGKVNKSGDTMAGDLTFNVAATGGGYKEAGIKSSTANSQVSVSNNQSKMIAGNELGSYASVSARNGASVKAVTIEAYSDTNDEYTSLEVSSDGAFYNDEEIATLAEFDTAYERTWYIASYAELVQLVKSGRHLKKLRYGDIFVIPAADHSQQVEGASLEMGTNTLTAYRFRVHGLDEEELVDQTLEHSLTLKCIEPVFQKYYNREVLFVAQETMPAGVYLITVPPDCGYKTEEAVFKVGVTQALDAGDWVAFNGPSNIYFTSNGAFTLYTSLGSSVTFKGNFATDDDLTENAEQYTELGDADGSVTGINFFAHAMGGGSEYSLSDIRVWANSSQSAAQLEANWTSAAPYAIKPKSFDDGFLYLLDPDFVAILKPVKKKTLEFALDGTVTLVESNETAFLESYTEISGAYNSSWAIDGNPTGYIFEGAKYGYYNHFGADMIDEEGTAYNQLLRSTHPHYNIPLVKGRNSTETVGGHYAFPCVVIA